MPEQLSLPFMPEPTLEAYDFKTFDAYAEEMAKAMDLYAAAYDAEARAALHAPRVETRQAERARLATLAENYRKHAATYLKLARR